MKNLSIKTFGLFITLGVALTLSGCADLGQLVDMPTSDSDLSTMQVPHLSGDEFVSNVKDIAQQLKYEIRGIEGKGKTERSVLLHRQSTDLAGALVGRDWQEAVAINLEADGHTIQVSAKIVGNGHRADPGTAKNLVDEFKARLATTYARK